MEVVGGWVWGERGHILMKGRWDRKCLVIYLEQR